MSREVTGDLMDKISSDVTNAMLRTLSLADERLPIAISGASAAIGVAAAVLQELGGGKRDKPDPDCILLAALICGRSGERHADPVGQAYADLETLRGLARRGG